MTYWFVNVDGKWQKPFTYYPVAKFNSIKKTVKIYEVNLDELPKKTLVWKSDADECVRRFLKCKE